MHSGRFTVQTRLAHRALTAPQLKLSARSRIERVIAEAFDLGDGGDRFEAFCCSVVIRLLLGDCDGLVDALSMASVTVRTARGPRHF
jgi:hypothetical protein